MQKKKQPRLQQIKDYYPLIHPDRIEEGTNASLPGEEDIENAKRWVDDTPK